MPDRSFAHLHCHSHYSLLDGASRIPELIDCVKQLGMNSVALTDHGNLFGAVELYRVATAAGIKPIIGYEAYVAPGKRTERDTKGMSEASFHLTLLAHNQQGFKNLIKMASLAYVEGFYYRPRIDKELLAAHCEGITCLSGCASSEFSMMILKDQVDEAVGLAQWYAKTFGEHFYIEMQNNGLDVQKRCAEGAIDIAHRIGVPLVVTSDAHYLCQADSGAHDVLLCINTGKTRSDENRLRYGSDQFYIRGPEEMYAQFPDHADAVQRSQEIADKCHVEIDFSTRHFPAFDPPRGKSSEEYLRELCEEGLRELYAPEMLDAARGRLDVELDVINRLGFAGYFLIVWDFVRFAREQGIPCGARGSACGAIVSYALRFSSVDPLEYDLLFERFLDPNRAEAPDIDIDFCKDRREDVIQYVREKYGAGSVAQIATFGTMAAKAAVRDVARVLDIDLPRADQIAKMIPAELGITLDGALKKNPDLRNEYENDIQIRELIDIARKLEGTNRNVGTHAAGVVIADGPITDYVPIQRIIGKNDPESTDKKGSQSKEAVITTQWTMEDLEKVGMLKVDFLGLRNLTLLDKAVRLIDQTQGKLIDLAQLSLDDGKTFELFQRGDTQGVFQFESEGIRGLLQRMKPDHIRDIIAANALYRPGPLGGGMVDAYINRKHGLEKPEYSHEVMEEILAETYGVMVYQEQVMRILNRLGGIELSSAYQCIKAISKKKQEIINKRKAEFIEGAQERGVTQTVAKEIFDLITHFGGYGFNKSHSTAYAIIAYQTAYLKAHYPAEFIAAVMSSEINNVDRVAEHFGSARRNELEVLPPDVNSSAVEFGVHAGKVTFGLCAIRGLGRKPANAICEEREKNGPYKDIFDFSARLDQRTVTKSVVETLNKAGAFDGFGAKRAQIETVIAAAMQTGSEMQEDRRHGQASFFDAFEETASAPVSASLPEIPEWPDQEKLSREREALGFYISSHPLTKHEQELTRFSTHHLDQLSELGTNQEVTVGGMLTNVRFTNAKRSRSGHTRMARFKIENFTGTAECIMFPEDYQNNKDQIQNDQICFIKGTVDRTRDQPGLIVNKVLPIEEARKELTQGVLLQLKSGIQKETDINRIGGLLRDSRGRCPVYLEIADPSGRRAVLKLSNDHTVDVTRLPVGELETVLGPGRVQFLGASNGNGRGH